MRPWLGYRFAAVLLALLPCVGVAQTVKPTISAIVNVASYGAGPIAPGEMVAIFGSAMGPPQLVNLQLDAQGKVATTLAEVQVLFDGTAAPLIYVSQTQISAMVPYGVAGKNTTQVQVVYRGIASDAFSKAVAQSAPGLFSADASGKGQAAINNSDGSPNSSANPAAPGSYVTFYLTGEGPTDPPGSDGNIATGTANLTLPIVVRIAGRSTQVLYAGSAPGNVNGFAQVNVVIPADIQYGGTLPLLVQIGDASGQAEITVAVAGPPAPLPGIPLIPSTSVNSSSQIVLTWTPADGLATRFHVERRIETTGLFTEIATLPASVTTLTDSNTSTGITYQYRIRAENDYGFSAYSTIVMATIPAIVQVLPPTNLQAVAVSPTQINLTWSAANANAAGFQIERRSGATGTYALIATVPSTFTSYQDATVAPNTSYVYRLRSQGASGFSAYSNEAAAATPLGLPAAPTNLQATAVSQIQINLSWTNPPGPLNRVHIERRSSTQGTYAEIAAIPGTSNSYQDTGLTASTSYSYRIRAESSVGLSPYSNEATAFTLAPPLPPAPVLQAAAVSSSQIHLAWISTATGTLRFHIERRIASGTYSEITQAGPLASSIDDLGLIGSTVYFYRMRVETGTGLSPYSNEATAATSAALPAAPTNLQGVAISSTELNLTWTNNAPDATAIRVEFHAAGSTTFTDIGAAVNLTSTGVTNLQPNATYTFRVRAQNVTGFSGYSNEALVTTSNTPLTVFLVHGIGESSSDSIKLAQTLSDPVLGITVPVTINAGFTWPCATAALNQCNTNCTIPQGAIALAQYIIANSSPGARIALIGHSMGGLLARDLMLNNWLRVFSTRTVAALITLGTPNVGYPFVEGLDDSPLAHDLGFSLCPALGQEMFSDYRTQQSQNVVLESTYLSDLNQRWGSSPLQQPFSWLAASGTFCTIPTRSSLNPVGCPDSNPSSDGVVCDQSARFRLNVASNLPTILWSSTLYAHTSGSARYVSGKTILCTTLSLFNNYIPLYDPPASSALVAAIRSLINGF